MNFELIVNEDVTMLLLDKSHAQALCDMINKNRDFFRRFLSWVPDIYTTEQALEKIKKDRLGFESKESLELGIFYKKELVGRCGFHEITKFQAEIGYLLDQDHTGKGIMTECTKIITHYGINFLKKHRIVIKAAIENSASHAIPKKIGYTYEGTERESGLSADKKWYSVQVWSFIEGDEFFL